MLFEKHKYKDVIKQLRSLLKTGPWKNKEAYLHSQYHLAKSYEKLGKAEAARSITERLISEGFKFDDMSPAMKYFFSDVLEK